MFLVSLLINFCKCFAVLLLAVAVILVWLCSSLKLCVIRGFYRWITGKPFEILHGTDAYLQIHGAPFFVTHDCITTTMPVWILKGSLDISKWYQHIHTKLIALPKCHEYANVLSKLTYRIIEKYGYFIWEKDTNFSIKNHVRLWDGFYEERVSLNDIVSIIYHQPLATNRSPWEFVLVPKKKTASEYGCYEEYAVIFKIHHSVADGSLVMMIMALLSDAECQQWFKKTFEYDPRNLEASSWLVKSSAFVQYIASDKAARNLTPKRICLIIGNLASSIFSSAWYLIDCALHDEKNNLHGPPLVGRKLMFTSENLDLNLFKLLSKACDCTVNDIFMSCIAGAVQAVDPSISNTRIFLLFGGLMPGVFGTQNTVSMLSFDAVLKAEENSVVRLQNISSHVTAVKSSPLLVGIILGNMLYFNHVPQCFQRQAAGFVNGTFGATNIRGPHFQIHLLDDVLTEASFVSMNVGHTMGISFSCFSYNGSMKITALVDRAVSFDDSTAKNLVQATVQELNNLYSAVLLRTTTM